MIAVCAGTRPEIIKVSLIIKELNARKIDCEPILSGQHDNIDDLIDWFNLDAIMMTRFRHTLPKTNDLTNFFADTLLKYSSAFSRRKYDLVVVQGDTSTTLAATLAAFYNKTPIAHIEAGLRTRDKYEPFPEEMNRRIVSLMADYHFCPTEAAIKSLCSWAQNNGCTRIDSKWDYCTDTCNRFLVGNTVIDALKYTIDKVPTLKSNPIVIALHRRESFGDKLLTIYKAVQHVAALYNKESFVIVTHTNPEAISAVRNLLWPSNVDIVDTLKYQEFTSLVKSAKFIITDSGGVQEEAGYLGIPMLVCRNETERPEVVEVGTARLVGNSSFPKIARAVIDLIVDKKNLLAMRKPCLVYGDGTAAKQIVAIMEQKCRDICKGM